VYDALQVRLNKRVAVKVMARELASNTEALNRFHREAMVTSGLGHPHIVQVFDFSTTPAGQPFLAMEFLDGEDLDRRIGRVGRLSAPQMVHIVKQVASALAATHAQQIVHRDLKPANIYLLNVAGEADFVKVLDFGISKIRAANTKITKASALIGTPDYMSPEQALGQGDEVDERTDQWALACIAWECLAGKAPFFGDSVPSMLYQVVHREPPSLLAQVPDLPRGVEPVLRKALSKEKVDRFANVTEFAQTLEEAVTERVSAAIIEEPMPAMQSSRARLAAAAATVPYEALSPAERSARPTTTFSQAATETRSEKHTRAASPRWVWAAAGLGAVALSLGLVLVLRPGATTKQPAARPTPVAAPAAPAVAAPVPPDSPRPVVAPAAPPVVAPAPPPAAAAGESGASKAAPAEAAAEEKPPAEPESKQRVRRGGSHRRSGRAAASKPVASPTEPRLIKEL
jgi:tRNA A-37 threonylcarbamoyl transferase component Bud32